MRLPDDWRFFDQESPLLPITGMIAEYSLYNNYAFDTKVVFQATNNLLLVVHIDGCSLWPEYGHTKQTLCRDKAEVDRLLSGEWRPLLDMCQRVNWQVTWYP
jgi:hypothetical protein